MRKASPRKGSKNLKKLLTNRLRCDKMTKLFKFLGKLRRAKKDLKKVEKGLDELE